MFLGEVVRPVQTVGIVFVLSAIVIVQRRSLAPEETLMVEPLE